MVRYWVTGTLLGLLGGAVVGFTIIGLLEVLGGF